MLRWGIVGFGWVARDFMLPGIVAAGDEVVAACDPDGGARATAVARGLAVATDLDGLLDRRPDAVYVATPNHRHRAAVEACAAAGVPVLCEKPLAATLADAEAMVAFCTRRDVLFGSAFDQRFHPAHAAVRQAIADSRIGRVTSVRIVYGCWLERDWTATEDAGPNWRIDARQAGGGAIMDLAPHGLDLIDALLGEPIVELVGLTQTLVQDYAVEDGGMLVGKTASGVLVSLHNSYNTPETLPRRRLEIVGTRGQIVATDTMGQTPGGAVSIIGADGVASPIAFDHRLSPFAAQARAFAAAVRGAPHMFDAARDLAAMRLLTPFHVAAPLAMEPAA